MKILGWFFKILLGLYFIVAIFLIASLLSYNDHNITVFGKTSFIVIQDNDLEPEFNRGDLALVRRNNVEDVNAGDRIFFYQSQGREVTINLATVEGVRTNESNETIFTLTGDYELNSQNLIGRADTSQTFSNLGTVFEILQSRWGFLFLIILPIFISFMYGLYALVSEIRADVIKARSGTGNRTE